MEEAPEKSKESPHSAHANGMNKRIEGSKIRIILAHRQNDTVYRLTTAESFWGQIQIKQIHLSWILIMCVP